MKRFILALICIILLVLDNSVMPFFAIKTVYPSLLFCFILSYSIINGMEEAVIIGVFSGLLQDIYFYKFYGVNAFINLFICLIAAYIGENIFKHKRFIPVFSAFSLTILKYIIIFIMLYLLKVTMIFDSRVLVSAIYNMLIVFFMYKRIYRFSNRDYMKEQWKFNKK
ncbi:rod shape-determining protein MreD [Clostridium polyendosporum]|uniref:Rod shape-determining protein MreD n=1 Tax=Clostridium polyendosporum TaxID=69208 RepID=A0A919S0T5_9CLOT|nr:rod shape-determining protein MreD [Clostridium polyendosporum]GIM29203.1 rod shape-determining protein MreD [Clostridium polyendosporum]